MACQNDDADENDVHQQNFIACVRSRKMPTRRCGQRTFIDRPGTETVIGDNEANLFVKRAYRTHWGTPKLL